jgi:hypothetical protein
MHKLALAVHQSADAVSAMSPVQCSRHWPAEVGFCGLCLQEQALSGGAVGWLRQWMHPMALACRRHQAWLQPVSIKRLAGIAGASEFEGLSRRSPRRQTLELKRETEIIDSALWLEDLVVRPDEHIPPWGRRPGRTCRNPSRSDVHPRCAPLGEHRAPPAQSLSGRLPRARAEMGHPEIQGRRWPRHGRERRCTQQTSSPATCPRPHCRLPARSRGAPRSARADCKADRRRPPGLAVGALADSRPSVDLAADVCRFSADATPLRPPTAGNVAAATVRHLSPGPRATSTLFVLRHIWSMARSAGSALKRQISYSTWKMRRIYRTPGDLREKPHLRATAD